MDLSFHNFTTFEQVYWVEYPRIQFINVSHSSVETIGILESETVQQIDISYCQLRWVRPGNFRKVKQLEKLFLHHNRHLTTIDLDAESLTFLDASHCSITEASLSHVPNLRELNLSHNRIKEIRDQDLADNVNLEDIDFSQNDIETISDYAFIKLSKLSRLDLSWNKIVNTDWTMTQKSLKILEIEHNEIETIEVMMLRRIQFLNISHNKLTELPEELGRLLPDLEFLDASSNPIRKIQRLKAKKLKSVTLSECRINEIAKNGFDETDLSFIDVSDNKLRNWDFVESLKNASIVLDDNPWHCACNNSLKVEIICQPENISYIEFCARKKETQEDPWFIEISNPVIWAPLIVALVIFVVGCFGIRTYRKHRLFNNFLILHFMTFNCREQSIPIDLIHNLPEEDLSQLFQLLEKKRKETKTTPKLILSQFPSKT